MSGYYIRMFRFTKKNITNRCIVVENINDELVSAIFNCVKIYPDLANENSVQKAVESYRASTLKTRKK